MNRRAELISVIIIIAFFSLFVSLALGMPEGTRRMPLLMGTIGLGLSILKLIVMFLADFKKNPTLRCEEKIVFYKKKEYQLMILLVMFMILIYAFGLTYSLPLFLFSILFFYYKETLKTSIVMGLGFVLLYYVLFVFVLNIQPYNGAFFNLF